MKNFIDRTRPLHMTRNKLKGKIGGAVTSAGLRHGGQEFVMDYLERYMRSHGLILADYQEHPDLEPRALLTAGPIGANVSKLFPLTHWDPPFLFCHILAETSLPQVYPYT